MFVYKLLKGACIAGLFPGRRGGWTHVMNQLSQHYAMLYAYHNKFVVFWLLYNT